MKMHKWILRRIPLKRYSAPAILQSWHFQTISSAWHTYTPSGFEFLAGCLILLFCITCRNEVVKCIISLQKIKIEIYQNGEKKIPGYFAVIPAFIPLECSLLFNSFCIFHPAPQLSLAENHNLFTESFYV